MVRGQRELGDPQMFEGAYKENVFYEGFFADLCLISGLILISFSAVFWITIVMATPM